MIKRTVSAIMMILLFSLVLACGKGEEGGKTATNGELKKALPAVPATPLGVSAVSGSDRITVKWRPSHGAASYNLYYADRPGTARTQGEKIAGITGTSYDHTGLKQQTMYYYVLTASNESGESPPSAESGAMARAVALQAPVNVAASGGVGRITVKWQEVPGATSYTVYVSTTPGVARAKGKKIEAVKSSHYELTDAKKRTMYYFAVTAVNASGESPASNESGAMP